MFTPRKFKPAKPQKRRSWIYSSSNLFKAYGLELWPGVVTLNSGYMALSLVMNIYVWLKKIVKYPMGLARFWVNLQGNIQVTRKPENVRMGKGKGARKAMRAYLHPGTFLFRVTSMRKGLIEFLLNKLQVRVPFRLSVFGGVSPLGFYGKPYVWTQTHMVQKKCIVGQFETYKNLLKKMHRPIILGYLLRIFRWRYIVPHAVWSPTKPGTSRLKLKRQYLRRRKILTFVKPQSLGFIRQLRIKYRDYLQAKQKFKLPVWRKVQARWIYPVKNVTLFLSTPHLPWDILLKAKRFKRILFYLNYVAFSPLTLSFSTKEFAVWAPYQVKYGMSMPARFLQVTFMQLRIALVVAHWRYLIGRSVHFASIF